MSLYHACIVGVTSKLKPLHSGYTANGIYQQLESVYFFNIVPNRIQVKKDCNGNKDFLKDFFHVRNHFPLDVVKQLLAPGAQYNNPKDLEARLKVEMERVEPEVVRVLVEGADAHRVNFLDDDRAEDDCQDGDQVRGKACQAGSVDGGEDGELLCWR